MCISRFQKWYLLCCFSLFALIPALHADDVFQKKTDDTFKSQGFENKQDLFSGNQRADAAVQRNEQSNVLRDKEPARKNEQKNVFDFFGEGEAFVRGKDEGKDQKKILAEKKDSQIESLDSGEPVEGLSLVLAGWDEKHIQEVTKFLIALEKEYDFPIKEVIFVGDMGTIDDALNTLLQEKKADIQFRKELPSEFPFTLAPTWLLHTRKGIIALEGINDIKPHINKKGAFVQAKIQMWDEVKDAKK